ACRRIVAHPGPSALVPYGSAHPADLHSFPTRRSSDLHRGGGARGARAVERQRRFDGGPVRDRPRGGGGGGAVARLAGVAAAVALDRKSTRLNSSHVKISYAVFCLKKKKNISTTLARML